MAVRLYKTMFCGYCRAAEALLERHGIPYEGIDISYDRPAREALIDRTGWRTVPVILADDDLIGGYSELAALDRAGKLRDRLLAEADVPAEP